MQQTGPAQIAIAFRGPGSGSAIPGAGKSRARAMRKAASRAAAPRIVPRAEPKSRKSFLSILSFAAAATSAATSKATSTATSKATSTKRATPSTKTGPATSGAEIRSKPSAVSPGSLSLKRKQRQADEPGETPSAGESALAAAEVRPRTTTRASAVTRAKATAAALQGDSNPSASGTKLRDQQVSPRLVVMDLRSRETQSDKAAEARSPRKNQAADKSVPPKAAVERTSPFAVSLSRAAEPAAGDGQTALARSAPEPQPAGRQSELGSSQSAAPAGRFAEMLRDEVVRHATVVVRDGGNGEIRLLLKPESLGEVRIRMKVVENTVEGRITVRSAEAREIFRENLSSLETALREQGFLNARLDVSVSDGGRDRPETAPAAPVVAPLEASEELERSAKVVLLADAGMHTVDIRV